MQNARIIANLHVNQKYMERMFYRDEEPAIPILKLHVANREHDDAHGPAHLWPKIRSAWNIEALMPSSPLTDEIIAKRKEQLIVTGINTP